MEINKFSGDLKVELSENYNLAKISVLYLNDPKGEPYKVEDIIETLKEKGVKYGFDESVIEYYLKKTEKQGSLISDIVVANGKPPIRKASNTLELLFDYPVGIFEQQKWNPFILFFREKSFDTHIDFPYKIKYLHKGEKIAKLKKLDKNIVGKNILGNEKEPTRTHKYEFINGEGVLFDSAKQVFTAGISGYFVLNENVLTIKSPFYFTKDKMEFKFLNLNRINNEYPSERDMLDYLEKYNIDKDSLVEEPFKDQKDDTDITIAKGAPPKKGRNAKVSYNFELHKNIGKVDDNNKINYKEKNLYTSVEEGELLATKKLVKCGEPGQNLMGEPINPPHPKDVILKSGAGTKKEKDENEMKIYSSTDGILEFNDGIISVFPTIEVKDDLNLKTGNIRTKANVNISGNVLAGFEVISEKNIEIKGTVEDNCKIKAKGDLTVHGGIIGENTKIECNGDLTTKYIESATVYCKGKLNIRRFLMDATIECLDQIIVFGHGINLNERGAIVNSDIKVRNYLIAPVIGSDASLKTNVSFAYDKALTSKIESLDKTCTQLLDKINEIKDKYEKIDITSENIHSIIKNYARNIKDEIINSIQQINKIKKKYKMMNKILKQNKAKYKKLLESANIEISKKIFPPLILHADKVQKTIEQKESPSKYYYDTELKVIERSRFSGTELES